MTGGAAEASPSRRSAERGATARVLPLDGQPEDANVVMSPSCHPHPTVPGVHVHSAAIVSVSHDSTSTPAPATPPNRIGTLFTFASSASEGKGARGATAHPSRARVLALTRGCAVCYMALQIFTNRLQSCTCDIWLSEPLDSTSSWMTAAR
jgi:hypothetical protein